MATYFGSGQASTTLFSSNYNLTVTDQHIYGSSRVGVFNRNFDVKTAYVRPAIITFERGLKMHELSNHLGNVLVTVSDKKIAHYNANGVIDYYTADVVTANDYYPGGMVMPGRKYSSTSSYRYGFNGKENDNEVKSEGNQQDYGMRIYDPRLGKFLSVDPLFKEYPWNSPYAFAENEPIANIDLDGAEKMPYKSPSQLPKLGKTSSYKTKMGAGAQVFTAEEWGQKYNITQMTVYEKSTDAFGQVHHFNTYYFVQDKSLVADKNTSTLSGTSFQNAGTNWHFYYSTNNGMSTQGGIGQDGANLLGKMAFGGAFAAAASPIIAPYAISYGTSALTASTGARFVAAAADAGVQYAGNLMEYGLGKQNLNNINWSSSGLAFINPASILTTGVGGNFLKYTKENGGKESIVGSKFNLKTSTLSSIVDVGGGKVGNFIQDKAKMAGFKNRSGLALGEVASNAAAAPVNTIIQAATEKKNR
jgi:RHS repeat-associated protein